MSNVNDFTAPSLLVPALRRDLNLRALETVAARLGDLDLSPLLIYDFDHCPAAALPLLAEQFNLLGDAGWSMTTFGDAPEATQRALLKEAIALHKIKGTRYAVERALELLKVQAKITEWWQTTPHGAPYTFAIDLFLTDAAEGQPVLTAERAEALLRLVKFWKPERAKFIARVGVGMSHTMRSAMVMRPAISTRVDMRPATHHTAALTQRSAMVMRPAQAVSVSAIPRTLHIAAARLRQLMLLRPLQVCSVSMIPI